MVKNQTVRRAAAVDLGSNTTLYLLGDIDAQGKIRIADEGIYSNGIGKEVFAQGVISPETIERNIAILREITARAFVNGAGEVLFAGTSALRNAGNALDFIRAVKDALNVELAVISGEDEARLSYLGFLSGRTQKVGKVLLIDIGGGSCEFILGEGEEIIEAFSLDIGTVRLLEQFPPGDPPDINAYRELCASILEQFRSLDQRIFGQRELIFSGGTATALAGLKLKLFQYDGNLLEGLTLNKRWLIAVQKRFLALSLAERKKLLHFDPDRAEIIITGNAILLGLMKIGRCSRCTITHRGLRFGLLAEWRKKHSI